MLEINSPFSKKDVGNTAKELANLLCKLETIIPCQFIIEQNEKGWYVELDTGKKYYGKF